MTEAEYDRLWNAVNAVLVNQPLCTYCDLCNCDKTDDGSPCVWVELMLASGIEAAEVKGLAAFEKAKREAPDADAT